MLIQKYNKHFRDLQKDSKNAGGESFTDQFFIANGITPDFIPHTEFHTGKCLLPVNSPFWYYFIKTANNNNIVNVSFLKSVDEPLKDLVQFLHNYGIKTTPSCAGHHFSEKNFEIIYNHLEQDKYEIRTRGLKLTDIETGKIYLFKNVNYVLPWERNDFLEQAKTYQQKGIIGIRLKDHEEIKNRILHLQFEGVSIWEEDSIVFIYVNNDANGENMETWKRITFELKKLF